MYFLQQKENQTMDNFRYISKTNVFWERFSHYPSVRKYFSSFFIKYWQQTKSVQFNDGCIPCHVPTRANRRRVSVFIVSTGWLWKFPDGELVYNQMANKS